LFKWLIRIIFWLTHRPHKSSAWKQFARYARAAWPQMRRWYLSFPCFIWCENWCRFHWPGACYHQVRCGIRHQHHHPHWFGEWCILGCLEECLAYPTDTLLYMPRMPLPATPVLEATRLLPPPNKRGWSYLLCAESSPDCEFLDCKGNPIGAILVKLNMPSSPYVHITLERFMKIAHIPPYDELTQSHMIVNGIAHWTFCKTATKGQLTSMGSPLGTALLFCKAAAEIWPLVNENTSENTSSNHTLPLGVGYHQVSMEAYLCMCHIASKDHVTRAQLKIHGITHWSFFIKSSKAKLLKLGFPLGTSRLLCDSLPGMQVKQSIKKDTWTPSGMYCSWDSQYLVRCYIFFLLLVIVQLRMVKYGLIPCRVIIQYHLHAILLPLYLYLLQHLPQMINHL
jgi:hypothetical protein